MAKIVSETIVVTFSKIVKSADDIEESIIGEEVQQALEQVAQELVGSGVVVEVEKA